MKAGERECLDEVKKDGKKKTAEKMREQQRRDDGIIIVKISVDTREAYDIIETITATKRCRTAWGARFCNPQLDSDTDVRYRKKNRTKAKD